MVWEEKYKQLQMLGRHAVSEMRHVVEFPHGLIEMQVVLCNPQICSDVHLSEQILHASCIQRLLLQNPRLL